MMAHTVRACRFIVAQYAKAVSDDGKASGLMSRSRESSSALIDLGQGTAVATSHELHAKIMLPADVRLPILFRRTGF